MTPGGIVDRYGTPDKPLVIAIHGAVANRKTWLPFVRVARTEYEIWCPDLPGHGARRNESFTIAAACETAEALIAEARPRKPILIGDSLGGYLALMLANRFGERLTGVVAGGCTWTMIGIWGTLARASDLLPKLLENVLGPSRVERAIAKVVPRFTDREAADAILEAGMRLAARSESLRALAGLDLAAIVREIRIPLVFSNGSRDWPTRAGEAMLLRANHRARLVLADGTGHGMGLLAPAVMLKAVRSVFADAAASTRSAPLPSVER